MILSEYKSLEIGRLRTSMFYFLSSWSAVDHSITWCGYRPAQGAVRFLAILLLGQIRAGWHLKGYHPRDATCTSVIERLKGVKVKVVKIALSELEPKEAGG